MRNLRPSNRPARLAAFLFLATTLAIPGWASDYVQTLHGANQELNRFVLDNGMVCLVKEDHSAPVVAVQVWVGVGSIHEAEFLGGGLSHYLEHMVFKGTPTRAPADVSKQIDNVGGDINAYTSFDRTVFWAELPSKHWQVGVDVLTDATLNASLPEEEWLREREVVFREVAMGKDDPNRVISKLIFDTAFRVHPYQHPVIGHEDILTKMTREELKTFHQRHYVTDNMIVVVVGDIDGGDIERYLRDTLSPVPRRSREPVVLPAEPPQLAPRIQHKTGTYNLSRLEWAYHTTPLSHPDTAALDVLAQVVGRGRSSRLVKTIKENQQLVFSIDAWSYTPKDAGLFGVSASFDPSKQDDVLAAIQEEVDTWQQGIFTEEELEKAKRQILVSELNDLKTVRGQASSFGAGEFFAGDARYSETYLERVTRLTLEDLQRVAASYLQPHNRSLALLTPESTEEAPTAIADSAPGANVQKVPLANGCTLLVREDARLPFVNISAAMRGGLLSETSETVGISQLTANLLTRGTQAHTAEDIAQTVESLGGSLGGFAGRNSFGLNAQFLSGDADTFLPLFVDCLLNPTFPDLEIEKQKTIQLAAIQQQEERPMYLASEQLMAKLFPDHPYQWTELGTAATVTALTQDHLKGHHDRLLLSSNLVISIFGDVTRDQAVSWVETHLSLIPVGPAPRLAHEPAAPALPIRAELRAPREQSILLLGYPGVSILDPRSDILSIMSTALSGLSSDLMIEIRDKRGLVYYAGAYQRLGMEPGCFVFYAGTQEESIDEVLSLLQEQADRIRIGGLHEEEWFRAREQIIARSEKQLQNNGSLAQSCALNELYGLGYDHGFRTRERLEAITADEIRETAEDLLQPASSVVSLVLPEAKPEEVPSL